MAVPAMSATAVMEINIKIKSFKKGTFTVQTFIKPAFVAGTIVVTAFREQEIHF